MPRNFPNWIEAFVKYASYMEAPKRMHFWAAVSTVAGALRRKVWFDQFFFRWYCNFYIIFVAPPGIVSKSTTADVAMELLREVPGINFGPDVITWQALVTHFAKSTESFQLGDVWYPMSAVTSVASELGNLLNPNDRDLVDLLITLWDGRKRLEKETKTSGSDNVEAPWINIIGCTTPHWVASNVPESMIGGGFTSRCVFIYADQKDKFVPYLRKVIPDDLPAVRQKLIQDLEHISLHVCGEYEMTPEAYEWGARWYKSLWNGRAPEIDDERFDGYIARKQTILHKLAMVLAASQRDERFITLEDLQLADMMQKDIEPDMAKVFARIGKSEASNQVDRLLSHIGKKRNLSYTEAYRFLHSYFPDAQDFAGIIRGAEQAGFIRIDKDGTIRPTSNTDE